MVRWVVRMLAKGAGFSRRFLILPPCQLLLITSLGLLDKSDSDAFGAGAEKVRDRQDACLTMQRILAFPMTSV